jgi:hypothetical protein
MTSVVICPVYDSLGYPYQPVWPYGACPCPAYQGYGGMPVPIVSANPVQPMSTIPFPTLQPSPNGLPISTYPPPPPPPPPPPFYPPTWSPYAYPSPFACAYGGGGGRGCV